MTDPRLDRRFDGYDEANKAWPIRPLLAAGPPQSMSYAHLQLDQGRQGACVTFGMTTEAAARPVPVFGDPIRGHPDVKAVEDYARHWYALCKARDGYPNEEGTFVNVGAQIGVELGLWAEYRWALGPGPERAADDVIRWVARGRGAGPAGLGVNWRDGMWKADKDGYLRPTGKVVGGHFIVVTKYNARRDAVWTPNSWGGDGQGWIARPDLVKLLADDGEGVCFVRRLYPTP